MIDKLISLALEHGDRLAATPYARLADLRRDLEEFHKRDDINGFQRWIVDNLYSFDFSGITFEPKSVLVMAQEHPHCADVTLQYGGKEYAARSMITAKVPKTNAYIAEAIAAAGYHCADASSLPLKRLGVCAGLSEYGRNNITYVEGLGSALALSAFVTDIPCKDNWREMKTADICANCGACIKACPTGAILKDRFLIDNERCISYVNEGGGDTFPDWVPLSALDTFYDCLICQDVCPMNSKAVKAPREHVTVCESDVQALLDGKSAEALTPEFREIAARMDLFRWSAGIPRNVRALLR